MPPPEQGEPADKGCEGEPAGKGRGESSAVVGMSDAKRDGPVDLFAQNDPCKAMGQRHGPKAHDMIGSTAHVLGMPVGPTDGKAHILGIISPFAQMFSKYLAAPLRTALVERNEQPFGALLQERRALFFATGRAGGIGHLVGVHPAQPHGTTGFARPIHIPRAQLSFRTRRLSDGENRDDQPTSSTWAALSICHIFSML